MTVVVPCYNDPRLSLCLDALDALERPDGCAIEIIVVDNGSSVLPTELVAKHPGVRLLVEAQRGSYAARNTGLRAGTGDFYAFTDADCRPAPTWLVEALARFHRQPDLAAVAGRVQLEFGAGGPRHPCEWWELVEAFPQESYVRDGFGVTANLVVRAAAVHQVGGFDAGAVSGGDIEFGARLRAAGHQLGYEAAAVVFHPARANWAEVLRKTRRTTRGSHRLRQVQGGDAAGLVTNLIWQLRMLKRTLARGLTHPALPSARARLGYLLVGISVRSLSSFENLAAEARHRAGRAL